MGRRTGSSGETCLFLLLRRGKHPQGKSGSSALANRALHGLQLSLELMLQSDGRGAAPEARRLDLLRYADDFIVTGTSQVPLRRESRILAVQLPPRERAPEPSHQKTRIMEIEEIGFQFLGDTVRCFVNGKIFLIKPSRRSIKTFLDKIQATIHDSGGRTAADTIRRLESQIKGWTT